MSAGARNRSYATHIGCIHELSRYRGCRNGMAEARVRSLSIQLPARSERPILSLPLASFLLYRSSLALCELPRLYYFTCIGFPYPLNYPPEQTSHSQHDHPWVVTGTMVVDKSVNGQPVPEIHHVNKLLPMVWNNSNVLELLTARSLGH